MQFNEVNENGRIRKYGFATYPDVVMFNDNLDKPVQHLIYGDYINLLPEKNQQELITNNDWVKVRSRGDNGWIKKSQVQKNRVLEINFVDIGQGDGCHIVTTDDQHIIVDAGEEDNMFRFLSWRFNLRNPKNKMTGLTAVITHPDQDHYKGFNELFESDQLIFSRVYHNGIVERANDSTSTLGSYTKIKKKKYLSDVIQDDASMKSIVNDPTKRKGKRYPQTLKRAIQNNSNIEFKMLHKGIGYVPDYEEAKDLSMQILAPIIEKNDQDKACLKYFTNHGKTKNGHSVSLLLRIGKLKILLGGDLNVKAENYLLEKYSGIDIPKIKRKLKRETNPEKRAKLMATIEEAVSKGREIFQADIAKACHHGSHYFTTEFLRCVNAIATVISSGDHESHGHPRPDSLGSFGKYGRGERPLIFSTELARSHKEVIKKPFQFRRSISILSNKIDKETDPVKKEDLQEKLDKKLKSIERSVAVYGMINVRTDGEHVIICQKLETPRNQGAKWDIHKLVYNSNEEEFEYSIKL